jgi:DNA-binding PadR family transcriptional regulator
MARTANHSKETLRVLQAFVLSDGPLYGGTLVKALGLKEGTVYPILHRLEGAGYLNKSWEAEETKIPGKPPRCYYSISLKGLTFEKSLRQRSGG